MPMLKYTTGEGRTAVYELKDRPVFIGRLLKCDIVISKATVSRRHARIYKRGSGWVIADEGSSHGTLVNGVWISQKELKTGDKIRIGPETLVYLDSAIEPTEEYEPLADIDGDLEGRDEPTFPGANKKKRSESHEIISEHAVESGGLFKTIAHARKLDVTRIIENPLQIMAEMSPSQETAPAVKVTPSFPEIEQKPSASSPGADVAANLLTLVRISDELRRCADEESVCKTAVEMVMTATRTTRGVLALATPDGVFIPVYQRVNGQRVDTGEVQVSSTFVERMVSKRVALIALDTGLDEALSTARSVVAMNIRSILCTPLWDGEEILGYLYLDNTKIDHRFGKADLDFVSAVAHATASEIGRLRLVERIREEEERRRNLGRFLSPDVIKLIDEEASAGLEPTLSAREQLVTVLFTDIRGFTSLSERMKPAEVKRFLDDYFDRMTEIIIDRYQGTLDKYIGDAIMALFGAPFSNGAETDARRAVAAAVEMRDTLAGLRKQHQEYSDIQIRVGINTGRMIAGMMGSQRRLEYSVIGDSVNVASRLESSAEPGTIQIGQSTHELVKDAFRCKLAGDRKVKNRAQPVRAYWVMQQKA